uniref:Linker l1b n=1 Tax=Glossoscolex paulistus TaxID=1046353 RepID=A0A0N7Z862_9ANNE
MRCLGKLLLLLLPVGMADFGSLGDATRLALTEAEIKQQFLRLQNLTEEMEEIKLKVRKLPRLTESFYEYRLNARITALEGSGCYPDQVQCGSMTAAQCLSDLFVCDGIKDCSNGRDEDPNICSEDPVKLGNAFVGLSYWSSCNMRNTHRSVLILTASKRSPVFKARVWVKAFLVHHITKDKDEAYEVAGYFNFARRNLLLMPLDLTSKELAVNCFFNRGDHVHLDCKIISPGTFKQCGVLAMARL